MAATFQAFPEDPSVSLPSTFRRGSKINRLCQGEGVNLQDAKKTIPDVLN